MDLRARAVSAVEEACAVLGESLNEEQTAKVAKVIERALIDTLREAAKQSTSAAVNCCSHDEDMAHKISREIDRTNTAIISNLSSLR